jgi:hypothetical protein
MGSDGGNYQPDKAEGKGNPDKQTGFHKMVLRSDKSPITFQV